jgi:hypothetical protein
MRIGSILFPIFNWGQAILIIIALVIYVLGAIFVDLLLTLYMGTIAYAAIVLNSLLRGLAPDEVEIQEDEIGPISAFLANERFVYPIKDCVWAPAMSRSRLFKSDWISINEIDDKKFILKARKRDLKIILSEIRPKKADSK